MQACPSDEQLRLLNDGGLSSETGAEIKAHVESCSQCLHRLGRTQTIPLAKLNELDELLQRSSEQMTRSLKPPPAESQTPLIDSIAGYELTREIHRGGQGVVYQAIQKVTKRKVAIKVMREGPFAGAKDKARFEREVQILAALNHPNIVAIHDSGVAAGNFYYVMEYISGQSLDVWMTSAQRSIKDTLALFVKICEAVSAAHLRGVIHRDLKPGNIRVDPRGEPYVLDFGLAKMVTGGVTEESRPQVMTVTGQFMGSLPWASPEQAEGMPSKIDIRTDVYSLGVILYQMLTNRFPYEVIGPMRDVLDRIMNAEPVRPSTIDTGTEVASAPGSTASSPPSGGRRTGSTTGRWLLRGLSGGKRRIDNEVETIVLKCLAKERDRRYQSAGELARDIRYYLSGNPIEAKRDSATYMLRKLLFRHGFETLTVATVLIILFGAGGIAVDQYWQARKATAAQALSAQQAGASSGVAGMAVAEAMPTMQDMYFPWFLSEWTQGRLKEAREVQRRAKGCHPAVFEAMVFLLDETYTLERLRERLSPDDEPTAYYAAAEREMKAGRKAGAVKYYQLSLNAKGNHYYQSSVQARLDQLSGSGTAAGGDGQSAASQPAQLSHSTESKGEPDEN